MALVLKHSLLSGFSGRLGDLVFRRVGKKTFVSFRPKRSDCQPTPKQLAARERFAAMARARRDGESVRR